MTLFHRIRPSRLLLCIIALVVVGVAACEALRTKPKREVDSPGGVTAIKRPSATAPASTATAPTTAPSESGALLTITITDLRNRNGDLIFGVFTQADGFPNVQAKSVYWEVRSADADSLTFTARLPAGRYAAGVLHDENRSGDMEKNLLGIPTEGYGVTNNPKPSMRKAAFEEATFTLPAEGATLKISLQYF